MSLSTHVLNTARGRPAAGLGVVLESLTDDGDWELVASGETDGDGRISDLPALHRGIYRLVFRTAEYFADQGVRAFYPEITVAFDLADPGDHYHVPLLLSPFGYSTYRGS